MSSTSSQLIQNVGSNNLCDDCLGIFGPDRFLGEFYSYNCRYWHFLDRETPCFRFPSPHGCPLCSIIADDTAKLDYHKDFFYPPLPPLCSVSSITLLVDISLEHDIANPDENSDISLEHDIANPDENSGLGHIYRLRLSLPPSNSGSSDRKIWHVISEIYLVSDLDSRSKEISSINLSGSTTNNEKGWYKAKTWINQCNTTHEICRFLRLKSKDECIWHPSRLLQVTSGSQPNSDTIRLRDALPPASEIQYATLSHCWGQLHLQCRLLHNNQEAWRRGVPISSLPRTFQDTIIAAKCLGLSYIWIDSLCIIQDSKDDWAQESSMMAKIYSCSYVNIAATAALDSEVGLFHQRNPMSILPCQVKIKCSGMQSGLYFAVNKKMTTDWDKTVQTAKLNTRGWVFQERLLASRIIHFASDQLYWECNRLRASESSTTGPILVENRNDDERLSDVKYQFDFLRLGLQIGYHSLSTIWGSMVMRYSNCELTYQSDKLIALSGIASEFARVLQPSEKYLAGLWLSEIPRMLLWSRRIGKKHTEYCAPSWSWASIAGSVMTHEWWCDGNILIDILEAETTPVKDVFGQISSGFICLKGLLLEATIFRSGGPKFWRSDRQENGKSSLQDERKYQLRADSTSRISIGTEISLKLKTHELEITAEFDDEEPLCEHAVYCVPVVFKKFFEAGDIDGIVLEPTRVKSGQFRRIGTFSSWGNSVFKDLATTFKVRKNPRSNLSRIFTLEESTIEVI